MKEESLTSIIEMFSSKENKYIIQEQFVIKFGFNTAAFLQYCLNKWSGIRKSKQLVKKDNKEWFYLTIEDATNCLHLSRDEQDVCLRKLESEKVIEKKVFGYPPKRYIYLNLDKIAEIIEEQEINSNLRKTHKSNLRKTHNPICGKPAISSQGQFAENPQIAHNTEESKEEESKFKLCAIKDDAQNSSSDFSFSDENLEKQENSNSPKASDNVRSSSTSPPESKNPDKQSSKQKKSKIRNSRPSDSIERASLVFIRDVDHETLVKTYSLSFAEQCYKVLSDWKIDHPEAEFQSDYAAINRWVAKKVRKDNIEEQELSQREERIKKFSNCGNPYETPAQHVKRLANEQYDRQNNTITSRKFH